MPRIIRISQNTASSAPRNPVARSPLMRKGGVHEKTTTTKRRAEKEALLDELEDWREAVEFEKEVRLGDGDE